MGFGAEMSEGCGGSEAGISTAIHRRHAQGRASQGHRLSEDVRTRAPDLGAFTATSPAKLRGIPRAETAGADLETILTTVAVDLGIRKPHCTICLVGERR